MNATAMQAVAVNALPTGQKRSSRAARCAPWRDFGRLDPLVIAKWDAEQQTWVWPDGPYDVFTERGLRLAEEDLDNCDYYNADEFTHWRPLPKPPTDKGAPDA